MKKEALSTGQSLGLLLLNIPTMGMVSQAGALHGMVRGAVANPSHPFVGAAAGGIRGEILPFHDQPYRYGQGIIGSNAGPPAKKTKTAGDDMRDIYGFTKVAFTPRQMQSAAETHGFWGPNYTEEPGTPMDVSMVNPNNTTRYLYGGMGGVVGAPIGLTLGSLAGHMVGGEAGGRIGAGLGAALGFGGGAYLGHQNAPPQLILRPRDVEPKMASVNEIYGFSKQADLAAPGLLARMGQAVRGAGQQGIKDFSLFRPSHGLLSAGATAARTVGHELMGSDAGRQALALGAAGTGLGAAGAGYGAYRFLRPPQQPQQPAV